MSRAKNVKLVFGENLLTLDKEEKRFATPEIVALYRAERLACKVIVDLCSGYGFQAFAFSQFCNKVISVELDPEKISKAKEHARILGIKNITFICGDVLNQKTVLRIVGENADVIFCDPERLAAEKERGISTIKPDIKKLLELYRSITEQIAIEFPPHIRGLDFDAEYEYLSLDGAVNRLTLYFGALKTAGKSVVLLPFGDRIEESKEKVTFASKNSTEGYKYILEPDPAVTLANLFAEAFCLDMKQLSIMAETNKIVIINQGNKIFFLSNNKPDCHFFTCYQILHEIDSDDKNKIVDLLKEECVEKVVLRYPIEPDKYWHERKFFEDKLEHGYKTIHLFKFDMMLLAEKV